MSANVSSVVTARSMSARPPSRCGALGPAAPPETLLPLRRQLLERQLLIRGRAWSARSIASTRYGLNVRA